MGQTAAVSLQPLTEEWDRDLRGGNPLAWPGYEPPEEESVVTGRTAHYALIEGRFDVLGGSMGAAHGEKVVRAFRRATDLRLPVVVVTSSGGARMQEGMVALIQMARTASAAAAHAAAGLLSVAVFRSPTTGGVFASYGSLCAIRAAEPGGTVGFAGPRVVELTTGVPLPEDSHTAESAYAAGLVDALVARHNQADWVDRVLATSPPGAVPASLPVPDVATAQTAWGAVERARAGPTGIDWAHAVTTDWIDLRGADPVVRAGLAWIGDTRVVAIAHDRFAGDGRPHAEGLRLAQRAIALAGRLRLPLVTFIDTPGAEPGAVAERAGIAGEIARTFAAMASSPVPTVAVCVGEGGSGGALSIGHADRLLILDSAVFSVISPEGAAAILERDTDRAEELAGLLRLTPTELHDLGVVDAVLASRPETLRAALVDAIAAAEPGDRDRRPDAATQRWVT